MAQPPEDEALSAQEIDDLEDLRKRKRERWQLLGYTNDADIRNAEYELLAHLQKEAVLSRLDGLLQRLESLDDEPLVPMRYVMMESQVAGLQQGLREVADLVRPCKHCGGEVAIFGGQGAQVVILTLATGNQHHRECLGPING